MGQALFKLWEALGGSLGFLIIGLIVSAVFWAWRREVQRAENDRKAFWAGMKEEREAREKQAARDRAESKEQFECIRAEFKERDERIERAYVRLASAVAALQGDVKVLLDRSNRSSGGEPGGQPRPFDGVAHQATPDQCDEDGETSSDEPVAPPPSASAAEDPAD